MEGKGAAAAQEGGGSVSPLLHAAARMGQQQNELGRDIMNPSSSRYNTAQNRQS